VGRRRSEAALAELEAHEASLKEADPMPPPTDAAPLLGPEGGPGPARLAEALAATGMAVEQADLSTAMLTELARTWLDEQSRAMVRRSELVDELDSLKQELAEIERAAERERDVSDWTTERERAADQERATERARAAAERAAAGRGEARQRAAQRVAEAEAALAAAEVARARTEAAAAARITDLEADVARRRAEEESATVALAQLEASPADIIPRPTPEAVGDRQRATVAKVLAVAAETEAAAAVAQMEEDDVEGNASARDHAAETEARLERASRTREAAEADTAMIESELGDLDRKLEALAAEAEADSSPEQDPPPELDEIEWYVMARLAAQRGVGLAGSVPFVVDDAFAGLGAESAADLVGRLARMAAAVQVVVLTDLPAVADWARSAGPEQAGLVEV